MNQPAEQGMTGATDVDNCPTRGRNDMCRCTPKCVCGFGPHAAVHGPIKGHPPGSRPWGHLYQPASADQTEEPGANVFHCDVCCTEIEEDEGRTDYTGRHFGLCEEHDRGVAGVGARSPAAAKAT